MKKIIFSVFCVFCVISNVFAAQQSIFKEVEMPSAVGVTGTPAFSNMGPIVATADKFTIIMQAPKTGTLYGCEFRLGTVTQAPTNGITVSFQDVTASTGVPDGTQDQYRVVTSGLTANTWVAPGIMSSDGTDTGTKRSVTQGDTIACVIEFTSFSASDSLSISVGSTGFGAAAGFPYASFYNSTSWANNSGIPVVALKYSDGTYAMSGWSIPYQTFTAVTYNSGSSPNEYGVRFSSPVPLSVCGFWTNQSYNATNHSYTLKLYADATAPGGSTLASYTRNSGTSRTASSVRTPYHRLSSNVTITANTWYRLTFVPEDTNNATLYQADLNAAAIQDVLTFGQSFYMTQANGAGWTNTTTARIFMGLLICGADDGVQTGGINRRR